MATSGLVKRDGRSHIIIDTFNSDLHVPLRKISIRSIQYVLEALQYEEACSHNSFVIVKRKLCDFTLWMPLPWMPGAVAPYDPLCTPLASVPAETYFTIFIAKCSMENYVPLHVRFTMFKPLCNCCVTLYETRTAFFS